MKNQKSQIKEKEPFKFSYTMPSLDWYDIIHVQINPGDYAYFKIEFRYGHNTWLIGYKRVDEIDRLLPAHDRVELGRLQVEDLLKFIDWCETDYGGSLITDFVAIDQSINLPEQMKKLFQKYK